MLPHARLNIAQPDEIRLPAADLVIVDETSVNTQVMQTTIDPALLAQLTTYNSEPGEEHRIQEAFDIGKQVAVAGPDPLDALRASSITPDHLRETAKAATLAATMAQPSIHSDMDERNAMDRLRHHEKHQGRAVAALLAQLARDLEAARGASLGVEWDAENKAKLENGTTVLHPVIRHHGIKPLLGLRPSVALVLLDADADLEINCRLFGADLRGHDGLDDSSHLGPRASRRAAQPDRHGAHGVRGRANIRAVVGRKVSPRPESGRYAGGTDFPSTR